MLGAPRRRVKLVLAVAAALAAAAPAQAAQHWAPAAPLVKAGPHLVSCLQTTGALAVWTDHDGVKSSLPVTLGAKPGRDCPSVAPGAVLAVNAAATGQILLAGTGGGSAFSPLPWSTTGFLADDGSFGGGNQGAVAAGGGAVAVGVYSPHDVLGVALQRADGTVVGPLTLPGPVNTGEPIGPLVGLDGAGRGLVVWGAGQAIRAATLSADGVLGAPQTLTAARVDGAPLRVAVGPDGQAAVAFGVAGRLVVATGTTAAGIDLATAAGTTVRGSVAIEPDGAAIAGDTRDFASHGTVSIASRAAGAPFTAPRTYSAPAGVGDSHVAVAIGAGRGAAAVSAGPSDGFTTLLALSLTPGSPAPALTPVPVASADVGDVAVVPGPAPEVLAILGRFSESLAHGIRGSRSEIARFQLRPGAAHAPRGVRLGLASSQRLGHPQALRLTLRCPASCAIRVTGQVGATGSFRTARAFTRGRHAVTIPYTDGGGSAVGHPVKRALVSTVRIGIDAADGELRISRRVHLRP